MFEYANLPTRVFVTVTRKGSDPLEMPFMNKVMYFLKCDGSDAMAYMAELMELKHHINGLLNAAGRPLRDYTISIHQLKPKEV